jgi:ParB/RepB/Spo0J family partition protein
MIKGEILEAPIDQIRPSPYQPRLYFELETIKESIKQDGMLVPPLVRRKPEGATEFELIDGERRWRAAKELGWKTITVQVANVDDETARRMVFTLNEERQPYTAEEYTRFFRRMYEQMGSVYAVAQAFRKPQATVWVYINISILPEHLQKAVWAGKIPVGFIKEMEPVFTEARTEIGDITRTFEYLKSPSYQKIVAWLERAYMGEIRDREELRKHYVDPYLEELDKLRIRKAKEAVEKIVPKELIEAKVTLEKPEELEKVAEVLKKEAKRRRETLLTPEEKARIEAEKRRKEEERRRRLEERRRREEEELRKKLEAEKRRIEEEVKQKAREELLRDREFIKEFITKEYSIMHETLDIEDIRELLKQKLLANIPPEKKERAENIFEEEWSSLKKRIQIFPEKSAKMEHKFDRLKELEEEGVFLTTLWDIGERAEYAGRGDFHGNCPPQVVEQCVLRLTKKGDLVVDPMAGSGTAVDVCNLLGRRCIAYDIKPPEWRTDIIQNDSRKIPLEDDSVDMVFLHPPYWDMVYYTEASENLPDLSRAKTLDEYLEMLRQVLQECYRILKDGKYLCILLGDRIKNGRFIPLCRKAANLAEEIGFIDCGYAVKFTKGSTSQVIKGKNIYAEVAYTRNLKIEHDLVMFFKKEAKLHSESNRFEKT